MSAADGLKELREAVEEHARLGLPDSCICGEILAETLVNAAPALEALVRAAEETQEASYVREQRPAEFSRALRSLDGALAELGKALA